jgi:hypothetical protein
MELNFLEYSPCCAQTCWSFLGDSKKFVIFFFSPSSQTNEKSFPFNVLAVDIRRRKKSDEKVFLCIVKSAR